MDKVNGKLTVFFEEPFWVGIFERKRLIFRYDRKIPDYFSVVGAP